MIPIKPSGFLFDLDGVFTIGNSVIPGAVDVIQKLNTYNIPFRFLTNTTMRSRASLFQKLIQLNFDVNENNIISANVAGVLKLRKMGSPSCFLALLPDAQKDYAEFQKNEKPDVIVIGDLGKSWTFEFMNKLFRMIMDGAEILALHKGKYYQIEDGLQLDTGAIITGLEYATGKKATVVGKPTREFFTLALNDLKMNKDEVVMIGDDLENDVRGAQKCGIKAGLVRTGKFRQDVFESSHIKPDFVLDSIGELLLSR
jgi:HAD superfamily hydrolase (TIGR01458 family)